ncbi:MAG: hypothetical protein H6838_19215 [Planctomycetes bacterium]|nr:hypothetical protein [Planctomycetota bacterium]
MSLEVRLGQRQEQRLALLPQMLQSIEVLQLATEDLLQYVEAEVQQNEALELRCAAEPRCRRRRRERPRTRAGRSGAAGRRATARTASRPGSTTCPPRRTRWSGSCDSSWRSGPCPTCSPTPWCSWPSGSTTAGCCRSR